MMGDFARSIMKGPAEQVRYEADAAAAASAGKLAVPVQVSVRKPSYAAAFEAAHKVLNGMAAEAGNIKGVTASVQPAGVRFAHDDKTGLLVQVSGLMAVEFPGAAGFWERAGLVAQVLDVVHRFCEPPKPDKDVAVYTGPAGVPT